MSNLKFTIDKNGVANLSFDLENEKINKLSGSVLLELEKALNVIEGNKAIRILIITSEKKDIFIAGADINEIKLIKDQKDAYEKVSQGQDIISRIEKLKIDTIAVINGACLGGGLELALACKYRVAIVNKKTSLGLPEVNLGIIPGFGGTQRLPKLIGLKDSLQIILSGKPVDANKAFKIGLVDDIFREEFLEEKLSSFVTEIINFKDNNFYLNARKARHKKLFISETIFLKKHFIFYFAKKNLWEKTKGKYPAPFYALEVIRRTYGANYKNSGYSIEKDAFCELAVQEISKNLIDLFFVSEEVKKDSGSNYVNDKNSDSITNVALIGAGVMGGGIAWLFANNNIDIRIKDITQNAINLGYSQVIKIFNELKKIRKLTSQQINLKLANITSCSDFSGFNKVNFAIEAVVENIDVKKKVIAELESNLSKDAVIVSNTSSLSITEMSSALQDSSRFAGMHFFNPVNKMPLVEVIKGKNTSDKTISTIVSLAKKLGKTPIVVKDVSGFLVNRILLPYMNEATYLLEDGAEIERIDFIIEEFGMPMGPFSLADVVGIDIGCKVANSLQEAYGERMKVSNILNEISYNHKHLLGKKSQKGFYLYNSKDKIVNQEIVNILLKLRKEKSIKAFYVSDSEILDRAILTMVNEASKCLEESVVKNAKYLDLAMIMGTGFPAFRGGLLKYADSIGIENVVKKLKNFESKIGKRFEVSNLLIEMANNNKKFYE